jgi:catechol 2,3-dioxygenase-like lactoylglutathione lyase family enzyme
MGAPKLQIQTLDHISLNIMDLAEARKFYGDALGLEEVDRPEKITSPGAWFRIGGFMLHLNVGPRAEGSGSHLALWTEDVYALAKAVEAAGFAVQWERKKKIPGVDRFFTGDPSGNRIEIKGSDGTVWAA